MTGVCQAEEVTTASWYSVESCMREGTWQKYGGKMANGEVFKNDLLICASWDHPFGTILLVTNQDNNKSVQVRVSDRGPSKKLYKVGRKIDLSKGAFEKIADLKKGIIKVSIKKLNRGGKYVL